MILQRVKHLSVAVTGERQWRQPRDVRRKSGDRGVEMVEQPLPAQPRFREQRLRLFAAVAQDFGSGQRVFRQRERQLARKAFCEPVDQPQLVRDRQLDVDALDAVRIVAEPRQRNHHVLVDLECVGVARNRCGTRTVEPEFPACFRTRRDETFAAARVGDTHHL